MPVILLMILGLEWAPYCSTQCKLYYSPTTPSDRCELAFACSTSEELRMGWVLDNWRSHFSELEAICFHNHDPSPRHVVNTGWWLVHILFTSQISRFNPSKPSKHSATSTSPYQIPTTLKAGIESIKSTIISQSVHDRLAKLTSLRPNHIQHPYDNLASSC